MVTLGIILSKIGIYFKSLKLLLLSLSQKIPYLIAISYVYINAYIKNFKTCVNDSIFNPDCISSLKTIFFSILILVIFGITMHFAYKFYKKK